MSPRLPDGEPVPSDGSLPRWAGANQRNLSVYVHVPYCKVRCGYCDFNTYTASELGSGVSQANYAQTAAAEIDLAQRVLAQNAAGERAVQTVFFGGGTPTLLPAADLAFLLQRIREAWGLAEQAEVTTEANPDSVDERYLVELAEAGFTRVSFGMQSAVPHVLQTLERTHDPARIPQVVQWAKQAGLQVSLDLIYGTPGESDADWLTSLHTALECDPDHVSAYALVVEEGTKMWGQVRRGELALPDEDTQADRYEVADELLGQAGYQWYEVSNWARSPQTQARHNLAYWQGDDWWGIGPGAHSYLGADPSNPDPEYAGLRWWNVKHPRAYAQRLQDNLSPGAGRELLTHADAALEAIMLQVRLRSGIAVDALGPVGPELLPQLVADGLVYPQVLEQGQIVLTRYGRLLADAVIHRLTA